MWTTSLNDTRRLAHMMISRRAAPAGGKAIPVGLVAPTMGSRGPCHIQSGSATGPMCPCPAPTRAHTVM